MKKIRYINPGLNILDTTLKVSPIRSNHNIWNQKLGINLLKDTDRDGKPDWIDCRPFNKYMQDEDDTNIITKEDEQGYDTDEEERRRKKQEAEEERERKKQEREEKKLDRELARQERAEQKQIEAEEREWKNQEREERAELSRVERQLKKEDTQYKIREHRRERTPAGRILKAGYRLAKDATKSYKPMQKSAKGLRQNLRGNVRLRSTTRPRYAHGASFMAPQGTENSLSGAVAQNNWAGERNVMNTQFFNDYSQSRDLLGENERRDRELVSSNRNLFDTNKETNIGTKKKEVKYF